MISAEKRRLNEYHVLGLFVLFSVVLFFILREIAGRAYVSNVDYSLIGQFTGAIELALKLIGIYLLILWVIAISGFWISRVQHRNELAKGFKFSIFYCVGLTMLYLVILLIV